MKNFILLFSAFFSISITTMPTYGMESEETKTNLTARSGREIKEFVKQGRAHHIHTVEVPMKVHYMDHDFDVSDIASCTNLKRLIIRNIYLFYPPGEEVLYDFAEPKNAQIMSEIAKVCPPSLTELDIRRTPSVLSGGANDQNLQEFAKRAPGITHLTIDAMIYNNHDDPSLRVTDEAFVNFPRLQSLVLYDAKYFSGANIDPSIVRRLSFDEENSKMFRELSQVFDYHVDKRVSQLFKVNKSRVLEKSAHLVVCGEFPLPNSDALIAGWELHTGKRWNGIEDLRKDVNATFDYLQERGAVQLKDLPEDTRKKIINKALDILNCYDKAQPSTTLLMRAWEKVMKKKWNRNAWSAPLRKEVNRVFDEQVAQGAPQLTNISQETREKIIEKAIDILEKNEFIDPYPRKASDIDILKDAWEGVMNKSWGN